VLSGRTRGSIVAETMAILEDKTFAPLFAPGSQAEVPIVASLSRPKGPGPALKLTGQIDRLAVTAHEVLIVDYKTNRPPPRDVAAVASVYLFQLAAYRLALRQIFASKTVRAALLWTHTPSMMPIPEAVLDDYESQLWELDPGRLDG
jgi:ATP-dependent helicase/nuclease subunit A